MRKIFIIALALFIAACGGKKESDKQTLIFAHKGEMQSLDPIYSYDGVTQGLILNIYDTVIKFKGSSISKFEPLISTQVPSIENGLISKDGLTYTFPIRKNVKFHNGEILTPEDVKYSILRFILSDRAGGPSNLLLEPILGVNSTRDGSKFTITNKDIEEAVKIEGDNVVIKLKRPFAPFLSIMARWSYIMNKKWCAENGEWDGRLETWQKFNNRERDDSYLFNHMNGTGPFKLNRWDITGKRLSLLSNENYFLGAPKIKNILLMTVDEPSTMRLMLESGDVDVAEISQKFDKQYDGHEGIILADNLPRLRTDPAIFFTYEINTTANPDVGSSKLDGKGIPHDFFTDKDLRKAFAHAFDYQAFLTQTMQNKGTLANGPVPPGLIGYDKNAPHYNFDLEKSKEYFKKAWGGKVWENGFKFTITYNTSGEMRQIACEILKRNIESLNPKFKIELRGVPWASFLEKTDKRQMPMWSRGWIADYADPHNFVFPFLHSRGRYALSQGFKNPKLDALIEQAVNSVNVSEREKLYSQIQKIAYEEAPQIYTVHPTALWAFRKNVKGFYDNPVFMGIYFYPLYKE
ncbi:Bacterial extracellular solute-binding protein family [Elusimicrobium minutum Pei191]|uniref:Bacterial extracellular solute-binding protein family n=1 Tax=Elusimicrobium minutum (strain Pei191) TaxID=445932 RepID=B2KBL2_ELUMP|nr:ABC transporter substrate-binding protein [Elusimicrobium minutum]ACC97699.1 Bacterial extracellular solute-binding protein family [Elusimicrobium minutum Pei191]